MPPGVIFQIWAEHLGLCSASHCPEFHWTQWLASCYRNASSKDCLSGIEEGGGPGDPGLFMEACQEPSSLLAWHLSFWYKKRGWTRQTVMITSWGKCLHSILFTGLHHIFGSSYHLTSSSDVSILIPPRVTISSEGLSWLNFFINWYPSSSNPQDKLCVMNTIISIMQMRKWGSERKQINFGHKAMEPAFKNTSGQLQSHRCWYSFTDRIKSLPSPKSCVKLEINDRWPLLM